MTDLIINLPRIDEDWLDENMYQIISDGIELLHMTRPDCIALSIGCSEFGDVFNDLEDYSYNNYYEGYPAEYEKAEKDSTQCARYLFEDHGIWDREIVTKEDIDNYNEALVELIHQTAENFAHGWVQYLGLPYDDGMEAIA